MLTTSVGIGAGESGPPGLLLEHLSLCDTPKAVRTLQGLGHPLWLLTADHCHTALALHWLELKPLDEEGWYRGDIHTAPRPVDARINFGEAEWLPQDALLVMGRRQRWGFH